MSDPYERAFNGLQPILPPQSPITHFCLLLYCVARCNVGTHRGKRGWFKVYWCTDSSQKIETEICKTAVCFFNSTHLACHPYYGLISPFTWVLWWLQCQSMRCGCHNWELADWFMGTYLQTHKTKRYLLFTYILNVPFTSYWINLGQEKVYFQFKIHFPFCRRDSKHNIPSLWQWPHNIPPSEQLEVNIPTLVTASWN